MEAEAETALLVTEAALAGDARLLLELVRRASFGRAATSPDGLTPLGLAARGGHLEAVKALLDAGRCDPNQEDVTGSRALHMAAAGGHVDVAEVLLARGAVGDAVNLEGLTAHDVAGMAGHHRLARLLAGGMDEDGDSDSD